MKNKYYNSIDTCPFLIFLQINEGKKGKDSLCFEGEATEEESENAWNQLYKEYVEEFGISVEYVYYLRKNALLCDYYDKYYNDNQIWYKTIILSEKEEIKALKKRIEGQAVDYNSLIGKLAKKMGFPINISKITIREFYSYVKS